MLFICMLCSTCVVQDALAQPSELAVVDKLLHLLRLSLATNVARDKESIDDNCYGDEGQCNEIVETLSCSIPQLLHTLLLNADQDENEGTFTSQS